MIEEMIRQAAKNYPDWYNALRLLNTGEKVLDFTHANERGRRELRGKLGDGKPAYEHWDAHVVRFRSGVVVGMGSSMKAAWDDAKSVAATVIKAVGN